MRLPFEANFFFFKVVLSLKTTLKSYQFTKLLSSLSFIHNLHVKRPFFPLPRVMKQHFSCRLFLQSKILFFYIDITWNLERVCDSRRRKYIYLFGHPRVTRVFSKLRGLQYFFPETFSSNLKFSESDSFSDSFLHCIFDSENFTFPFFTKNNLTWGVKWEKWNFRKSWGIY